MLMLMLTTEVCVSWFWENASRQQLRNPTANVALFMDLSNVSAIAQSQSREVYQFFT
jgi:hypothetical protein